MYKHTKLSILTGLLLCTISSLSAASTVRGNVQEVGNSFLGLDNFIVVLEPGWIRFSCSGSVGNIPTSQPLPIIYMRADSTNDEVFQRSYSTAMTSMLSGKKVHLHAAGGPCGSPGFAITGTSDN